MLSKFPPKRNKNYYLYKFHNSYVVNFVYFILFVMFVHFVYIFFIFIHIYVYIHLHVYVSYTCSARVSVQNGAASRAAKQCGT